MTSRGLAHPEYLVDPSWLHMHLEDPDVVVVDVDAEAGYSRGDSRSGFVAVVATTGCRKINLELNLLKVVWR